VQAPRILVLKLFKWWGEKTFKKKLLEKTSNRQNTSNRQKQTNKQTNNQLVSPTRNRIYNNRIYNLCKEEATAAEASVCQKASTHFQKGERTNWTPPNVGGVCVCFWPCLQRQGYLVCLDSF